MPVKLLCAGDLMTGENVHHFHRGIPARFKGRYMQLVNKQVLDLTRNADVLLLNFEASMASEEELNSFDISRGVYVAPEETIGLIKSMNENAIVSVANNHFGQHGRQAATLTIERLRNQGVGVIGADTTPLKREINGLSLFFWGVSLIKDTTYEGAYVKSSYETLIGDLNLPAKAANDVWILSIHWGEEYYTLENERQVKLAQQLAEAGFDYIIGHHPHVVQPVRRVGEALVFYSHGNFIFDQNFSGLTQKGLVSEISIPAKKARLFLSRQSGFRIRELTAITAEDLAKFCASRYHKRKPLLMRIRMKLELIFRFYELNGAIIKTFTSRLFKT